MPSSALRPLPLLLTLLVWMAVAARPCAAQTLPSPQTPPSEPPAWKLGGQIFGDYYVVAAHDSRWTTDDLQGRQGFWLRRVYLTYDHRFSPRLSTRLQLEANSAGDFLSATRLEPFVKDAYVHWRTGGHAMSVGLVPSVSLRLAEQLWGLRSVEKSPLDLFRFDSSRDLGVVVGGPLAAGGRVRYELQVGNGAGVSSETDDAKSVRGAVSLERPLGLTAQVYVDQQARSGAGDRTTIAGLAAWRQASWRVGGLYAHQRRRDAEGGRGVGLDLVSVFGVARVRGRVHVFGRADRLLDPLPGAGSLDYLPLSSQAEVTLWLTGLDIEIDGPFRLQPHVQVLDYAETPGTRPPGPTVIPRVTVALSW